MRRLLLATTSVLSFAAMLALMGACGASGVDEIGDLPEDDGVELPEEEGGTKVPDTTPTDAGADTGTAKDSGTEPKDAAPPKPPEPPTGGNMCDPNDPNYMLKALGLQLIGQLTPCPCGAGQCCVEEPASGEQLGCVKE